MIGFAIALIVAVPTAGCSLWAARNRDWVGAGYFGGFAFIFGVIAILQWIDP